MNSRQYYMLRRKKKGNVSADLRVFQKAPAPSAPFTFEELRDRMRQEPVICKHFGCGKTLNLQEQLYGQCCVSHCQERQINQGLVGAINILANQ